MFVRTEQDPCARQMLLEASDGSEIIICSEGVCIGAGLRNGRPLLGDLEEEMLMDTYKSWWRERVDEQQKREKQGAPRGLSSTSGQS